MIRLTEIIRARMFNTRRQIGAEVHTDTGTYKPKNPPVKDVNIVDIRSSWEGFDKAHKHYGPPENRAHVEKLTHALRHGKTLPPVILRRNPEGLGYQLVDGNHRYHAHVEAGRKTIPAITLPPILAQGKRRKRITGKRKKMYESNSPIISIIRKVARNHK